MNKINITNYDLMINKLREFSNNNLDIAFTDESIFRSKFVTNFIEILSTVSLDNESVINALNVISNAIVTLQIPIIDLYNYFKTKKMSLLDIENFVNSYLSFYNKKDMQIYKIYLSLLAYKNENKITLADILQDSILVDIHNQSTYIKPKIGLTYKLNENNFTSVINAQQVFYQIPLDLQLNTPITNKELNNFLLNVISSYANKSFVLLKLNESNPEYDILNFLNNFNALNFDLNQFQSMSKENAINFIKNIFINNISSNKLKLLIEELCKDIYDLYISDANKLENANKEFDISGYLPNLIKKTININICSDGKITDFYKYLIYSIISNNINIPEISKYINEIIIVKNYIEKIRTTILNSDSRFERGD